MKKSTKKTISIYPFWVICDLMVNYIEIQDFAELPCISLLRYTWNDTENALENWENVLEKVLEKCLIFFFWKSVLTMLSHRCEQKLSHVRKRVLNFAVNSLHYQPLSKSDSQHWCRYCLNAPKWREAIAWSPGLSMQCITHVKKTGHWYETSVLFKKKKKSA